MEMGTRKEGEAGVYEEIKFTNPRVPRPAPTPYEHPQTSLSKLDITQLPPLPTESYYQRPRANTDSRVKDMIVKNPHYDIPHGIAAEGASTTESAVPGPSQYDSIRPRTSSTMVANCPVYAPLDIKKV